MSPQHARTDNADNVSAFACHSDTPEAVLLAGSFNDWDPNEIPMARGGGGHSVASLKLAPGRYESKFAADGDWCSEPGCTALAVDCSHCIMNFPGTMNRVLAVP